MLNQGEFKELCVNPTIEIGVGYTSRTKNGGSRYNIFRIEDDPEFCQALIDLGSDDWTSERLQGLQQRLLERLVELGVIFQSGKALRVNPAVEIGAGYRLRTRNEGAKFGTLGVKNNPELCRLLIEFGGGHWTPERLRDIPQHLLEQLVELGILIRDGEIDEAQFLCLSDRPHLDLIPRKFRQLRDAGGESSELVVNRGVHAQAGPELPVGLADRIPFCNQFRRSEGIIWVEDPGTKVLAPYWMKAQSMELVQRLLEGQISPYDLPAQILERLVHMNVLVPKNYEEARIKEWQGIYKDLYARLRSEQYVAIRDMVHPLQLASLRHYFRLLDQKGGLFIDTYQGNNRFVWQNDAAARFVHHQITGIISQIVPEPIKPSYSLLSIYKSGAILKKHTDRPQCVWNLSLLIDSNPEVEVSDSWPIYFEIEGQVKDVRLDMGDGVLYSGTDIPHWRDALPDGHTATLILCHFVPSDFGGSLY